MAITPEDTYTKILNKIKNIFRNEFGGSVPVYVGHETKPQGSQYIRLDPLGSELIEFFATAESREYTINMYYYFLDKNIKISSLEHVLRYTSRIEALVHDNISTTLSDTSNLYNCRIESTELNALEEENEYVVLLVWKGQHTGNIS
tara:strand:+ start:3712 stop:4149 length:438 start_codon:yes stop_codon:yes gene_type:complete